ncbi:glucose-6-phosphate isomerase family protein [Methanolobus mangrovi]|uniref:glucose-6-phosphate isomerase n=1 Tax=Methanolobus mangrovi TaxID=3072977 RepID=A0AA51UFK0_9EURY|nr:glucose-6-phosphate isomerase family protein [Methanolobus mangrovi]WMW22043.1 glucose-6-phosphate isomerase family protein [Methanolobus mangrovi]
MGNELNFGGNLYRPDIRMLHDMDEVVYNQEWLRSQENIELYYMYRDLSRNESDHKKIVEHGLRYDITIIPPAMLGDEYVKTAGHYHPPVPGQDLSYAELYQVLEGEATYLLQKAEGDRVVDVIVCEAKAGDLALVPPGYGHITINTSGKRLKMANWVCRDFASLYDPIKKLFGGAYYLLTGGFEKNPDYGEVPDIRFIKPMDYPEAGLFCGNDMYEIVNDLNKLDFLVHPQDHMDIFGKITSP